MFERLYHSSMKLGARILFGVAILIFVVGAAASLSSVGRLGQDNQFQGDWMLIGNQLFAALSNAVMPFFGALLIDRLDRWLSARSSGDISN